MLLQRLYLHNWCQYPSREILFKPGLNAFVGPIGRGKSNALNAIVFALLGDYRRNVGDKAENIYQLAPADDPAYVELTVTHQQYTLDIVRSLRGKRTSVKVSDLSGKQIETVSGESKVTTRIGELLSINEKLLNDYVFVAQGQMFAPFDANVRPAERIVAFQRLFGIDRIEELWAVLGERLNSLPIIEIPDLTGMADSLTQAEEEVKRCQADLLTTTEVAGWSYETDPANQIIQNYQTYVTQSGQIKECRAQLRGRLVERRALRKAVRESSALLDVYRVSRPQADKAYSDWQQAQIKIAEARHLQQQISACEQAVLKGRQQLQELDATLMTMSASISNIPIDDLRARYDQLRGLIAVDKDFIRQFAACDGTVCPTCQQPVSDTLRTNVAAAKARMPANEAELAVVVKRMGDFNSTDGLIGQYQDMRAIEQLALNKQLETLTQLRTLVSPVTQSDMDALQASANTAVMFLNTVQQQEGTHVVITRNYQQLVTRITDEYHRLRDIKAKTVTPVSTVELEQAKQDLSRRHTLVVKRERQLAVLSSAERRASELTEAVARVTAMQVHANKQTAVRRLLTSVRDVLHRDNLPAKILQCRLSELRNMTNEGLAAFNVDFRLESAGMGYTARFTDGRVMPLVRLSGGQKVLTALAFRIATNSRFANELGLICLDEPTVSLDNERSKCLEAALTCLRKFSQTRGLQCVLITHDDMNHLFDHVERF